MSVKRVSVPLLGLVLCLVLIPTSVAGAKPAQKFFTKAIPWHLVSGRGRVVTIGWNLGNACDPTPVKGPFVDVSRQGRTVRITIRYRYRRDLNGDGCFEPDYFGRKSIALDWPVAGLGFYDGSGRHPWLRWRAPALHSKPWGRTYRAETIHQVGGRSPIAEPFLVEVSIGRGAPPTIGWGARCNDFSAPLRITAARLIPGQIVATAEECRSARLEREDEWLGFFFESDPRWDLDGTRLTLRDERAVIVLAESR